MEARKKLFGPNQSGGSRRRRPLEGVEQPRPYSSKLHGTSYGEVQARCNRLQVQNEALRTQNHDLARELNDVKYRLRHSRQKERELERTLIKRDRANRGGTPENSDAPVSTADRHSLYAEQSPQRQPQLTKNNSDRSIRKGEDQGRRVGRQGKTVSVSDGRGHNELTDLVKQNDIRKTGAQSSSRIPEAARSPKRDTVGVYLVGKAAPLGERQNSRRESILPNTLVDLHPGGREGERSLPMENAQMRSPERTAERLLPASAKLATRLAPSPAPAYGCIEDREYLPEDGMFRMDSSEQVHDEAHELARRRHIRTKSKTITVVHPPHTNFPRAALKRSSSRNEVKLPTTPVAPRCATIYTSTLVSSSSWPSAASPRSTSPLGGSPVHSPEDRCDTFSSERGCAPAISPPGVSTARSTEPLDPPKGAARLPSTDTHLVVTPRSMSKSRPRRSVARPLSYQEPSLGTKMRRGHVMFPKKKLDVQDAEKSQLMKPDKENEGRRYGEDEERL